MQDTLPISSPTYQPLAPVGHVSLMIDTFIANTNVEDLRAVVRALLVTGPPNTTSAFQKVAKQRLRKHRLVDRSALPPPSSLFTYRHSGSPYSASSSISSSSSTSLPSTSLEVSSTDASSEASDTSGSDPCFTPQVKEIISRARVLFGAGLGIQSLPLLTLLIRGTQGLRWSEDGTFVDSMAILDSDIAQAIQSAYEEVAGAGSNVEQVAAEDAVHAVQELRLALEASENEVEQWGGEFPFQRGLANVEWLERSDVWLHMSPHLHA